MITEYFLRINEEFYDAQKPWKKKEIQQFRKNIIKLKLEKSRLKKPKENIEQYEIFK